MCACRSRSILRTATSSEQPKRCESNYESAQFTKTILTEILWEVIEQLFDEHRPRFTVK